MIDSSVYRRPDKPKFIAVRERAAIDLDIPDTSIEVIKVDKQTECHVTPAVEAKAMVEYASPSLTDEVLEPSAGTGNLVNALLEYGISHSQITAIEKNVQLYNAFNKRFDNEVNSLNDCFLDFAKSTDRKFDRIIINPPFKKSKQHIEAAKSLLKKNGVLVFLVQRNFSDDESELLDELPENTFPTTKILTKTMVYYA